MAKAPGKTPGKTRGRAGHFAKRDSRSGQFVTVGFATKGPALPPGVLGSTRLKKAGGSLVATVPAAARNLLHLTEGQNLAVKVEGNRVVMEPMPEPAEKPKRFRKPKYTLEELVQGMDPDAPLSEEERAWMDAPPAGREVW